MPCEYCGEDIKCVVGLMKVPAIATCQLAGEAAKCGFLQYKECGCAPLHTFGRHTISETVDILLARKRKHPTT